MIPTMKSVPSSNIRLQTVLHATQRINAMIQMSVEVLLFVRIHL